jgi:hypothetical protein
VARRRSYRRPHHASKADAQALAAIFALIAACIAGLFWLTVRLGRWYVAKWQQADRRGRMMLAGGLVGTFVVLCGIGALSNPSSRANSSTAPASQAAFAAAPRATEVDPTTTAIPEPTAPPSPTAVPPTTTTMPTPPAGQVAKGGNLRSEPRIAPETVIGQLCANDGIEFVSQQLVGKDLWYRVRVTDRKADCTAKQVALGTEGWASSILLSEPSYAIEDYARAASITLPTAKVPPTATPKPTAVPRSTAVPKPAAAPASSGVRVGAICRDGTRSYATGRGACSHHGGVDHWLYQ